MKTPKALKKLTKIEALIADVTARYTLEANRVPQMLQEAKAAVSRAKDAVTAQASSEASKKNAPTKISPKKKAAKSAVPAPVLAATQAASSKPGSEARS